MKTKLRPHQLGKVISGPSKDHILMGLIGNREVCLTCAHASGEKIDNSHLNEIEVEVEPLPNGFTLVVTAAVEIPTHSV